MNSLPAQIHDGSRLYRLHMQSALDTLHVEAWAQREAVSQLTELRLICLSLDAHIELKSLTGQPITLETVLAQGDTATRSGIIKAAEKLDANGGLARYRLTVVPWFWLATQQRRSQIFQDRSVDEIIQAMLAPYAKFGSWRYAEEAPGFLAEVPRRSYCTQYRESDFDFLARLLAEEGLGWRIEENESAIAGHELVIFSDSANQPESSASPARFHRSSSQESSDTVQTLVRRTRHAVSQISLAIWNVDGKALLQASAPNRYVGNMPRALQIEYDDVLGLEDKSRNIQNSATLEHYAGLLMEAVECRSDTLLGHSTLRVLSCGLRLGITEAPALGLEEAPEVFVSAIEHVGFNNLPAGSKKAIDAALGEVAPYLVFDDAPASPLAQPGLYGLQTGFGMASKSADDDAPNQTCIDRARQTGYANLFSASLAARPWRPAALSPKGTGLYSAPRIHGAQTAIVVGPDGQAQADGADELYGNARGDIRLKFHWQTDDSASGDSRKDNSLTRWVRVAQQQAGPGMGWQWMPRIGQEVLVKFAEGDPDQPIVMDAVYNGRGTGGIPPSPGGEQTQAGADVFTQANDRQSSAQENLVGSGIGGHAPAWHGASPGESGHRNAAALWGFKSKEFGAQGYNQLVFDDSDQQLRVQLHTSTAHSQLNLGHIIHQQDNYRGSFRGQGIELRTDAYAALRGGHGVLLTTYHGPGGSKLDPAGDAAGLLALARQLHDLTTTLSQAAGSHQAVPLASAEGAKTAGTSMLDPKRAPAPAFQQTIAGTVTRDKLDTAYSDAAGKHSTADAQHVPQLSDPVIGLAARGGIAAVAGQHMQWMAGETITLASSTHVNFAFNNTLRVHSGQAISLLAAAGGPDQGDTGLHLTAAQDAIDLQAQHDQIKLLSSDTLTLQSVAKHIDLASAKKVRVATAQGASITIEGGNITFACPGTITYYTSQRLMGGPANQAYALPIMPGNVCVECLAKRAASRSPFVNKGSGPA